MSFQGTTNDEKRTSQGSKIDEKRTSQIQKTIISLSLFWGKISEFVTCIFGMINVKICQCVNLSICQFVKFVYLSIYETQRPCINPQMSLRRAGGGDPPWGSQSAARPLVGRRPRRARPTSQVPAASNLPISKPHIPLYLL